MEREKEPSSHSQKQSALLDLLGILAFVFGVWSLSKMRTLNNDSGESIHPQDTRGTERQSGQAVSGSSLVAQPPTNPDNPKDRRRRKTPWWEVVAVVIAFGLLIANWFQGCQTQRASETATKALELSQRPWVSLENFTVESPLAFDKDGNALITFSYEIKNTGHSPAIRGFWQQAFFPQFGETPSPVKKRDDACNFAALRSTKVTDSRLTETWFPGDGIPKKIQVNIESSNIVKALEIPKQILPGVEHMKEFDYLYPDFIVCVAYRAAFTDTQYHTGYILELRRTNPKMPYIPPMKSGEIPAKELGLFIHPFYGIYAD